jgi:hypothetical protein
MWYEIDVSGLHIGPIFKGNMSKYILILEMEPISNAETSVSCYLILSDIYSFVMQALGEEEIIEIEKISCKINYSSAFKL